MKTPQYIGGCRRARIALIVSLGLLAGLAPSFAWNAADVMGPDGLIYPDFSRAGIPGGVPTPASLTVNASTYGAVAGDSNDDSTAIQAAIDHVGSQGGGVVQLGSGSFHLDKPLNIAKSGVVLRGAGRDATKLLFRYTTPTDGVVFYQPAVGLTTLHVNTWIEMHADPVGLNRLTLLANDIVIVETTRAQVGGNWNGTFSLTTRGDRVYAKLRDVTGYAAGGDIELRIEAEYDGGAVRHQTRTGLTYANNINHDHVPSPSLIGAINITGLGLVGVKPKLAQSATRGSTSLTTQTDHELTAGDVVYLLANRTPEWDAETGNLAQSHLMRHYLMEVTATSGNTVTLNQPLRIDYPLAQNPDLHPTVQRATLVGRCGIENLTLEQTSGIWTNGIVVSWAKESWVRNVKVVMAGRNPVHVRTSRACEVRDSIFDRVRFTGLGGTGYVGFGFSFDCLMEDITTYGMRHAPTVQSGAAGNVIRNSTFVGSDMQWHGGWANENLYENCVVEANLSTGSYGYGMWSAPPESTDHGPIGPRNVVYNCDLTSPYMGAQMNGSNKGWSFVSNRMAADAGPGWFFRKGSSDHVIADNVVVLGVSTEGIHFSDAESDGTRLYDNVFKGVPSGRLVRGAAAPAYESNNSTSDWMATAAFADPGFENTGSPGGWSIGAGDGGMSAFVPEAARSGGVGLRVVDASGTAGSSVFSQSFPVVPGRVYATRFWQKIVSGENLAVYLLFFDQNGTQLTTNALVATNTLGVWIPNHVRTTAPLNAATAKIWVHSINGSQVVGYLDDFEFGEIPEALPNADFEQGLAHWTVPSRPGNTVEAIAAARRGSVGLGLRVTDTSTTQPADALSRTFPILPGQEAQARFWAICRTPHSATNSGIAVQLCFYSGTTQLPGPGSLEVPISDAWRQHTVRAVAPAGADSVRVWIRGYVGTTSVTDFDNLSFLILPPRPVPANGSLFEWQRNPVFPVESAGFENGFSGWLTNGAGTYADNGMSAIIPAAAYSGGYGLRVTDTSGTSGSSMLQEKSVVVQPGATYEVTFKNRLVSGSAGIGVYLLFYDGVGARLYPDTVQAAIASSWQTRVLTAVAPANAVTARIWIHSYNNAQLVADFDDFTFRRL